MKLIVAFRNFANAPKNSYPLRVFEKAYKSLDLKKRKTSKKKKKSQSKLKQSSSKHIQGDGIKEDMIGGTVSTTGKDDDYTFRQGIS